jgi:hypothetical protein
MTSTTPTCAIPPGSGSLHEDSKDDKVVDDKDEHGTTIDSNCNDELGPLPTVEQVLQCQFSSWYPTFSNVPPPAADADAAVSNSNSSRKQRTNVTLKSIVLPLDAENCEQFRAYLSVDGVHLPVGAKVSNCMLTLTDDPAADEWSSDDDDDDDDNNNDNDKKDSETAAAQVPVQFHFDDLNTDIEKAIASLGGSVVPKLNWSTPRDAIWINSGTLKCCSAGDVYLLVKSSDFCSYDAQHALLDADNVVAVPQQQQQSVDVEKTTTATETASSTETATTTTAAVANWPLELVLRKWCNLYPSQEFRCFVRDGELMAISQRHHSQHYGHLVRDQYLYRSLLVEFFDDVVADNFPVGVAAATADTAAANPDDLTGRNYVFDVYVDKQERVWLLDFNVWGRQTDTLLFEWSELLEMVIPTDAVHQPDIRVVETDRQVRQDPMSSYRAPIDTVHVASMNMTGDGDASKFEEFMTLCEKPTVLEQEDQENNQDQVIGE